MLSFKLSQQNIISLKAIDQLAANTRFKIEGLDADELSFIRRNVQISVIGGTTRIENAVLTDPEIDWLDTVLSIDAKTTAYYENREAVLNKLSKDKERSIDEVAGSRGMMNLIYSETDSFFPLTEVALRGLHHELLRYYDPASRYRGSYKDVPNRVVRRDHSTGKETVVLEPSAPGPITNVAMSELISWYNETLKNNPWPIAVATEFVFRFLAIHPFQDGNGRVGRALFLLALLTCTDDNLRLVSPYLPFDRYIEKYREEYYLVLNRVSNGIFNSNPEAYNYDPFLRFMIKVMSDSFQDFDFYRKRYSDLQDLSPSASQVLNAFKEKPELMLQSKDIVNDTGIPRQTVTLALKTLTDKGFIQRRGKGSGVRYKLIF